MKKYYFIDFDSVKQLNVKKSNFDCKTYIYLFYNNGAHTKNIDLDSLQILHKYAKKVEFIKVPDEKHLLGKFLCGKLGMVIGSNGPNMNNKYIIISPKSSYDAYIEYFKSEEICIERINNFNVEAKKDIKKKIETPIEVKKKEEKITPVKVAKEEKKKVPTPTPKKEEKPVLEVKKETLKSETVKKEPIKKVEVKEEPIKQEVKKTEPKVEVKKEPIVVEAKKEIKKEEVTPIDNNKEINQASQPIQAPETPYSKLYGKLYHQLSTHKNDNGNKYSSKVKKDVSKLVISSLENEPDLHTIFTKLKERYIVTYSGIYNLVRKCVLAECPEVKDYVVPTIPTKEEITTIEVVEHDNIHEETKLPELPVEENVEVITITEEVLQENPQESFPEQEVITVGIIDEGEKIEEVIVEKQEEVIEEESTQEKVVESVQEERPDYPAIRKLLASEIDDPLKIDEVIQIIMISQTLPANQQKRSIYTSLSKLFGRNQGSAINKQIKELL